MHGLPGVLDVVVLFSLSITSGSGRIASIEITSSILPFHSIDSEKGDMNYEL